MSFIMVFIRRISFCKIIFILSLVMGVIFFSLNHLTNFSISTLLPKYLLFNMWKNFVTHEQKEIFDRKPSYPWMGDVLCQNFTVQVSNTTFILSEFKIL